MNNFQWVLIAALLVSARAGADTAAPQSVLEEQLAERVAELDEDIQARMAATVDATIESRDFVIFGAVGRMIPPAGATEGPEPLVQAATP